MLRGVYTERSERAQHDNPTNFETISRCIKSKVRSKSFAFIPLASGMAARGNQKSKPQRKTQNFLLLTCTFDF